VSVWRRDFDRLSARVDAIDREGSRGVAVLQTQMTDLAKDVAELKGEASSWQATHERAHQAEARDRISGRRWLVTTGIAGLAAMATAIGLLIDIAAHIH
jgi:hypothetical protein